MKWLWSGVTVRPLQVFSQFWPGFVGRGGVGVGSQVCASKRQGFSLEKYAITWLCGVVASSLPRSFSKSFRHRT